MTNDGSTQLSFEQFDSNAEGDGDDNGGEGDEKELSPRLDDDDDDLKVNELRSCNDDAKEDLEVEEVADDDDVEKELGNGDDDKVVIIDRKETKRQLDFDDVDAGQHGSNPIIGQSLSQRVRIG
ncbi:acidic leucine-rich nuclear phosphoprotein 32 family member B-like [Helianthus annuus]|uniref:acidic leucine-rich nuclear phosphoprotein 32 family member B-like n=1 Tax=Helianthus annuus TaxID=4232 RepID=UPI000B8FFD21|nr:acidic leucine-rich nuclear phosphoprotein 32 family member B-like [Helianthus annuus]